MKIQFFLFLMASLFLASCLADNNDPSSSRTLLKNNVRVELSLDRVFNEYKFMQPVALYQSISKDWYIVEQGGVVYRIDGKTQKKSEFINISTKVKSGGEMGMLGFALDPEILDDSIFYASYTGHDNYSYISRFHAKNKIADKNSEEIILKLHQPYDNHNGGQITFGPDGFLYIGFGDGGAAGDPKNHAQNTDTLLGSLLRIDVKNGSPYSIPDSNPLVGKPGKDEIYAFGLRNPWRWSFDRQTGKLWLADVGQNAREEINIIEKGHNYGWNILEGTQCFTVGKCEPEKYSAPILDYDRKQGKSVTGGFVYRGKNIPALQGYYVYGDFISGKIWALTLDESNTVFNVLLFNSGKNISSFAEDLSGELYVIDYGGGIYAISGK